MPDYVHMCVDPVKRKCSEGSGVYQGKEQFDTFWQASGVQRPVWSSFLGERVLFARLSVM